MRHFFETKADSRQHPYDGGFGERHSGPHLPGFCLHGKGPVVVRENLRFKRRPLVRWNAGLPARADSGLQVCSIARFAGKHGKLPSLDAVGDVVKSPFYAGFVRLNGRLYPGRHEPLVPFRIVQEAERQVARRRRGGGMFRAI